MVAVISVALLWLLFGGSHIALAVARPRLVPRLGTIGFTILFYGVAALTFTALVTYYGAHRFEGPAGPALGHWTALHWALMALAVFGLTLAVPALVAYPRLPSALFDQPIGAVRGIERVTRHPFFAGTALFAAAHVLLASRLTGVVFFGGWLLFTVLGAWHQDHKLRARRGRAYADYCAATSVIPFGAVLSGRQPLSWRDVPLGALAAGLVLALLLRQQHDHLFAGSGFGIAAAVTVGGAVAGINAWRRSRRRAPDTGTAARGKGNIGGVMPEL